MQETDVEGEGLDRSCSLIWYIRVCWSLDFYHMLHIHQYYFLMMPLEDWITWEALMGSHFMCNLFSFPWHHLQIYIQTWGLWDMLLEMNHHIGRNSSSYFARSCRGIYNCASFFPLKEPRIVEDFILEIYFKDNMTHYVHSRIWSIFLEMAIYCTVQMGNNTIQILKAMLHIIWKRYFYGHCEHLK